MEKLDLNVKLEGAKDVLKKTEEAVKEFFASLWTEELKANNPEMDAKELDKLVKNHVKVESEKLIVDTSSVDPRIVYLDTYCVLTQSALDILSNMGEEYVTVEKENIKVKGLKKHKKIVSDIYHITLKDGDFETTIDNRIGSVTATNVKPFCAFDELLQLLF